MAALAFLIDANAFISIGPALVVFNPTISPHIARGHSTSEGSLLIAVERG